MYSCSLKTVYVLFVFHNHNSGALNSSNNITVAFVCFLRIFLHMYFDLLNLKSEFMFVFPNIGALISSLF